MAATLIGILPSGDASDSDLTIDYRVRVSAESDWNSALAASGLPTFGSEHATRKGYYAKTARARQENPVNHYMAVVSIRYETFSVNESATAPWDDPATYSTRYVEIEICDGKYYDPDGAGAWKPNTNSAGDWFNPAVARSRFAVELTINIARQASAWSPATFDAAVGCVNSAAITICGRAGAAYQWRLMNMPHSKRYWKNPATSLLEAYYDVSYVVLGDAETHRLVQLDMGFQDKMNGGKLQPITRNRLAYNKDTNNDIVQELTKLNGSGIAESEINCADVTIIRELPARLFTNTYAFADLGLPPAV